MKKKKRCEYCKCRKIAKYPLRLKDGSVIAWYCKEHYEKVIKDFADQKRVYNRNFEKTVK